MDLSEFKRKSNLWADKGIWTWADRI